MIVHVRSSNVGYDGTHGGCVYAASNAADSGILGVCRWVCICNTLFMKQESKLVTYVAGSVKSTVDCIIVWQGDKAKVRNVKVIPNEECVPKHK